MKSRPLKDVRSDLDPCLSKLIEAYCHKLKLESSTFVPLGLHADGVPHQKRKTIEVFHWNFLGEANTSPSLSRILATVVESSFACQCGCQGRHTLDAIMKVLCWSFRSIITGSFPKTRHDGSAFASQEKQRSTLVGPLGAHGGILHARGDWSHYKRLFSFPGWQSKRICWRCAASSLKGGGCLSLHSLWRGGCLAVSKVLCSGLLEGVPQAGERPQPTLPTSWLFPGLHCY